LLAEQAGQKNWPMPRLPARQPILSRLRCSFVALQSTLATISAQADLPIRLQLFSMIEGTQQKADTLDERRRSLRP
jgi:hypothetical protein